GGSTRLGTIAATFERLLLSVVVLAVPTVAMGGTLPAAARAVTRSSDVRRQHLATLYAMNTLGAVAECLVATFFLLELFGTRATLWLAAAINLLIAILARGIERGEWEKPERSAAASGGPASPRSSPDSQRAEGESLALHPNPPALPALPDPPNPPDLPDLPDLPALP